MNGMNGMNGMSGANRANVVMAADSMNIRGVHNNPKARA
jgi:hypothetical protein